MKKITIYKKQKATWSVAKTFELHPNVGFDKNYTKVLEFLVGYYSKSVAILTAYNHCNCPLDETVIYLPESSRVVAVEPIPIAPKPIVEVLKEVVESSVFQDMLF